MNKSSPIIAAALLPARSAICTERLKLNKVKMSNHERKRGFWENLFKLQGRLILKGFSKAASAVIEPLKINAIIETSRKGRRVFVKRRHLHGGQMADLANLYFHTLNIPIGFLNKVKAWQRWEINCFNMLNGDRFQAVASGPGH